MQLEILKKMILCLDLILKMVTVQVVHLEITDCTLMKTLWSASKVIVNPLNVKRNVMKVGTNSHLAG